MADLPESEDSYHDVRVGWSVLNSDSTVGESRLSFAYCKNGSFVCHGRSTDYGQEYNTGDTITCCIVSFSFLTVLLLDCCFILSGPH